MYRINKSKIKSMTKVLNSKFRKYIEYIFNKRIEKLLKIIDILFLNISFIIGIFYLSL